MGWNRGCVGLRGDDKLSRTQRLHGGLHCALGKACFVRNHAQTHGHGPPALARGATEEEEVNQIGGRLLIVRDKVAHQDVEHVVIDGDSPPKTRHGAVCALYR